jgi:hypothetical protein
MTPPSFCPVCHRSLDAAFAVPKESVQPKDGDYSVCAYCGAMLRFSGDLSLRIAADSELEDVKKQQPRLFVLLVNASNLISVIGNRKTTRV